MCWWSAAPSPRPSRCSTELWRASSGCWAPSTATRSPSWATWRRCCGAWGSSGRRCCVLRAVTVVLHFVGGKVGKKSAGKQSTHFQIVSDFYIRKSFLIIYESANYIVSYTQIEGKQQPHFQLISEFGI